MKKAEDVNQVVFSKNLDPESSPSKDFQYLRKNKKEIIHLVTKNIIRKSYYF